MTLYLKEDKSYNLTTLRSIQWQLNAITLFKQYKKSHPFKVKKY